MVDLENILYKNRFLFRQTNSAFYYTLPSANAVHYSIGLSPERVFGGPLKILSRNKDFDKDPSVSDMPYIYAFETQKHYYNRVAKNNLNILLSNNKTLRKLKRIIKKKLYKLVNDFCFDYSYMLLIPTNNENLNTFDTRVKGNNHQTFAYYLENFACRIGIKTENITNVSEAYNIIKLITPKSIGKRDGTMMGNLCSNTIMKNMKDVLKIKLPTFFKISQLYYRHKYCLLKKYKIRLNPYFKN